MHTQQRPIHRIKCDIFVRSIFCFIILPRKNKQIEKKKHNHHLEKKHVSFFGGCAGTVVNDPRVSSGPFPNFYAVNQSCTRGTAAPRYAEVQVYTKGNASYMYR